MCMLGKEEPAVTSLWKDGFSDTEDELSVYRMSQNIA